MKLCMKVGMKSQSLQIQQRFNINKSFEIFVGRPNLILFTTNSIKKRNYIDVKNLVSEAYGILKIGAPTPFSKNLSQLEKMAVEISYSTGKCTKLEVISQNSFSKVWQFDFFSAAKWLTHLEEFTVLPIAVQQMQFLQSIWHVFGRIYKTGKSAELRKKQANDSKILNISDQYYLEMEKTEFDMSWLSPYPFDQVKLFLFGGEVDCNADELIGAILKLDLSQIEICYMTAQLCFQYAETRFAGTNFSGIGDRLLAVLDNDLHQYYMTRPDRNRNYAWRLAQMLKMNQSIQRMIRLQREKSVIAHTFDIFIADFSHPEMFIDTGC
ncbi:hypothetical protein CRE_19034 [Caenorhabditis remanei]|uniref:NR LBD domain-containing protein n=1 Tax=Caenorhabditis remanei TaxID=31234 RepID=E3LLA2_CAERE|nr:hypothetical protein CRE_19034 [Caenorhabditis remanei]